MATIVVTGTDTGIGKTIFSAGLTLALEASYWKPVQAGLDEETDTETVARLTGRPTLPEAYRLKLPASPHKSAKAEGVRIRLELLTIPTVPGPLVIEGAGGLMVPLSEDRLYIDQMAAWRVPVILCARTALGTINHSLLSIAALRARSIPLAGIAFIGGPEPESEDVICRIGGVKRLGRLPHFPDITAAALKAAMADFDLTDLRTRR